MKRIVFGTVFLIFLFLTSFGQMEIGQGNGRSLSDGPYIFRSGSKFISLTIENGKVRSRSISAENFQKVADKHYFSFEFNDLKNVYLYKPEFNQVYKAVDSIIVISDIHGRYKTYTDVLLAQGVIDEDLNWSFGKGHLVVIGDVFDRGDMVNEVLWHLFGLERQAEKAGGMVHYILGNHETMLFFRQKPYVNPKYTAVEQLAGESYYDLYSPESVLGAWIRTKPVVIRINDILFVHGGISMQTIYRKLDIGTINKRFYDFVMGKELSDNKVIEDIRFLNGDFGPVWYRGYFDDPGFNESNADSILAFFNVKHLIVGHTQNKVVNSLFGGKIIGIDTSDDRQHPGEILLYKDGILYRCLYTGQRIIIRTIQ